MRSKLLILATLLGLAPTGAVAQLNSNVNVEGEYEPLVIETERLNTFPLRYKFELPASDIDYEYEGVVTDFRPDLLTMGVTGRMTEWPWKKRRGYLDGRLGSYLDSRVNAGYFIVADTLHTLFAGLNYNSTAFKDPEFRKKLYVGGLGLRYSGQFPSGQRLHAEAEAEYLAYERGKKEMSMGVGAGYARDLSDRNTLGIDAKGDFFFPHKVFNNFGIITLRPFYRYSTTGLSLRIGADMAVAYDAMGKAPGDKFGTFHIAPDVSLQCRVNSAIGVFFGATGGVKTSTSAYLASSDSYRRPWLFSPQPIYTPVDAVGGVEIGPFSGFSFSAAVRYAVSRNVPIESWRAFYPQDGRAVNLHGVGIDLNVKYSYGSYLELRFAGGYTPQKGKNGVFNGIDRPRWLLEADAAVRPVRKLKIQLGYAYRGVRNCYAWNQDGGLEALRLPDITDLNAKISYGLLENLDIYCKGTNLINRRTEIFPGLVSEGIVISGGFYVEF